MNRTTVYLGVAACLTLLAVLVGFPRWSSPAQPPAQSLPTPPQAPPVATVTDGSLRLDSRLSHPFVMVGRQDLFMTVDVTGAEVAGAQRMPVNLAVVIDRSGSMSGPKLAQAKQAARHLVSQLRDGDRLTVVHYGSDVQVFPGLQAHAENRARMLSFIDSIEDQGGTNIGDALDRARAQLLTTASDFKVNRIILITDGQPTEGITDSRELIDEVKGIRAQGISMSAIGVGEDFNEDLLQAFAEYGTGSYGYMRDASGLATIFQKDLQQAATTVARNVDLSFELPEQIQLGEVLGYRWSQTGRTVHIPMVDFSAGEVERVVIRLSVNAAEPGKAFEVARLKLAYTDLLKNAAVESDSRLAAMTTSRPAEVLARQDKQATVYAARAQSGENMRRAAEAFNEGKRDEANQLIQANQALLSTTAAVAGPAAVEEDQKDQREALDDLSRAKSSGDISLQVKKMKRSSMQKIGKNAY